MFCMSRKNIILLVLFLILVSLSVVFYLYIKNQELQNPSNIQKAEENKQVELLNELKSLRKDSGIVIDGQAELKKLEALRNAISNTTSNTTGNTSTKTNTTPKTEVKTKTPTELLEELKNLRSS